MKTPLISFVVLEISFKKRYFVSLYLYPLLYDTCSKFGHVQSPPEFSNFWPIQNSIQTFQKPMILPLWWSLNVFSTKIFQKSMSNLLKMAFEKWQKFSCKLSQGKGEMIRCHLPGLEGLHLRKIMHGIDLKEISC